MIDIHNKSISVNVNLVLGKYIFEEFIQVLPVNDSEWLSEEERMVTIVNSIAKSLDKIIEPFSEDLVKLIGEEYKLIYGDGVGK